MAYTFTKNFDNMMLANCGYLPTSAEMNAEWNETGYLLDANTVSKKFNAGTQTTSTYYTDYPLYPVDELYTPATVALYFNAHGLTVCDGTGTVNYYDYKKAGNILFSQMDEAGSNTTINNYDLKISKSLTVKRLEENSKHYIQIKFQLRNDGADTKNISEICFAPRCKPTISNSGSFSGGNRFLMFHEIFTPVAVGPGDYFDYENKIEIPNFRPNKPTP